MIPRGDRIEIITSDHTSIADEDQAVEPESLVQVGDGLADGGEATLNRILKGRVQTCKLNTLESIAAALGYEVKLVKKAD